MWHRIRTRVKQTHGEDAHADRQKDMPLEDRAADTWEALIAIADQAGDVWPQRARRAAALLTEGGGDQRRRHAHSPAAHRHPRCLRRQRAHPHQRAAHAAQGRPRSALGHLRRIGPQRSRARQPSQGVRHSQPPAALRAQRDPAAWLCRKRLSRRLVPLPPSSRHIRFAVTTPGQRGRDP